MHIHNNNNIIKSKMISEHWKSLEDKSEYVQQAEDDKARHAREMKSYTPPPEEDDDASPKEDDDAEEDGARPVKRSHANVDMPPDLPPLPPVLGLA